MTNTMTNQSLPLTERETTLLQELLLQEVTRLNAAIPKAGPESRAADSMRETALILAALGVKLNRVELQYRAHTLAQQILWRSKTGLVPTKTLCDEFQEVLAALGADIQDSTVQMASRFLNGKLTPNQS